MSEAEGDKPDSPKKQPPFGMGGPPFGGPPVFGGAPGFGGPQGPPFGGPQDGDLLNSGGHLALETEDLTIPLDEVDEGLVDRLEVPEGVGEVEGVLLIVHSEGVEEVPQRGALEVVEVQEVVGEVSQDHGMMDQWMVLKVVLHLLGPLGVRRHLEETTKGALAIMMNRRPMASPLLSGVSCL